MNTRSACLTFLLLFLCGCATFTPPVSLPESPNYKALTEDEADISDTESNDVLSEDSELSDEEIAKYENEEEEYSLLSENRNSNPSDKAAQSILNKAIGFCRKAQDFWEQNQSNKALKTLDEAYALILSVKGKDSSQIMQQKEDLRFMISKRILEIYASRNVTTKGKSKAIPIVMNDHVRAEIASLLRGNYFMRVYKRSGKYRPRILEELKKAGIPAELSWLPLIESGFTPHALSSARALGLWQFIPSTGYKFGLKRNNYVDERMDPEKATKAAIAYLKELHGMFGDWSTVLAAYNCGEGRVLRVIRTQNVNYLDNFWDLYKKLPRETARYVPRFMATLHIINNLEKYGLDKVVVDTPPAYETLNISKQVRLKDVARELNISPNILKELNPELRKKILPPKKYALKIPVGKSKMLLARIDEISTSKIPQRTVKYSNKKSRTIRKPSKKYVYHRVKRGDTLHRIAKKYGMNVKKIMRANKMSRHYLVAGKILKIPATRKMLKRYSSSKKKSSRRYTHVVKKGDSLWNIARKYGTTPKDIHRANRLPGNRLSIGQVLKIPGKYVSKRQAKVRLRTYRVRNGDVPRAIAQRHKMPLKRFLRVNHLTSRSKIYPGQKLYVE